ncbi:MAG: hypothetical protein ACK50C_08035 [Gemmatimonadaceae bacterium]
MRTPSCSRWQRLAHTTGVITALSCATTAATGQPLRPSDGGTTVSLGQPSRVQAHLGLAAGALRGPAPRRGVGELRVGAYRELLHPVFGLGGLHGELYGDATAGRGSAGVRLRVVSPLLRLGAGIDVNAAARDVQGIVSFAPALRRGGLLGHGTTLRVDALIGPRPAVLAGIDVPIRRNVSSAHARQRRDQAPVLPVGSTSPPLPVRPTTLPVAARALMDTAHQAALNIRWLAIPWLDHTGGGNEASDRAVLRRIALLHERLRAIPGDTTRPAMERETRRFHAALDHAFAAALQPHADAATASRVSAAARALLLRDVLLPYDRLLGQDKRPDTTRELAAQARAAWRLWLEYSAMVPPPVVDPAGAVFEALLDIVEEARAASHAEWGSARHVWLPLQYALRPEDHDSQAELDAVLARATGAPFHDGNMVSYLINEQFQWQLHRTIHAARDYHVLQIHDFRGLDDHGDPDAMSFRHVLRSYVAAMTERVRAYDSTGTFPTYLIVLDQYFYEARSSRLWIDLLERPLDHRVSLPPPFAAWQDSLVAAQQALRDAIAGSAKLTAQRAQFGEAWLRNLIKVHVNITNVASPTFFSWRLATGLPVPDNITRDHRKIAFYDITEADPLRGEALLTGAGVGAHYAGLAWEDRSILVRGPVNRELKRSARDLLLQQGLRADEIPLALRPAVPTPSGPPATRPDTTTLGSGVRAALLVNETGFADKDITVARAVLYTLLPAGSVIAIPGPLWNSAFLGAALVGTALRGGRVLVITPSRTNSQSRSFGSQVLSRELFWRLLMVSRVLGDEITGQGGLLKVGVFAQDVPVTDIPAKVLGVRRTLRQHPWLRDLFDFPPAVYAGLDSLAAHYAALPPPSVDPSHDDIRARPNLHIKAHFIASRDAWRVMARPEWVAYAQAYVTRRMTQLAGRHATVSLVDTRQEPFIEIGDTDLQRWMERLPPAERDRVIFYTLLGSTNQNARGVSTDGEVMMALSGWMAVTPMLDVLSIIGQSRWVENRAELDALIPPRSGVVASVSHWLKAVF